MPTFSNIPAIIAVQNDDEIKAIYAQYNGHFYHTGRILMAYYATLDKVNSLIDIGDVVTIGRYPIPPQPHTKKEISMDDDICIAANPDDEQNVTVIAETMDDETLIRKLSEFGPTKFYLFRNNQWLYAQTGDKGWIRCDSIQQVHLTSFL